MEPSQITAEKAAELAAAVAHERSAAAAEAHLVERLDRGAPYFLVTFGKPGSPGTIVAVNALDGSILSSAHVERVENPWLLEKAEAVTLAGGAHPAAARLVWAPSRATLSPFYPLWELTFESGRVYVDRNGKLWHDLPPAGPG
jgi:hypothetical protein